MHVKDTAWDSQSVRQTAETEVDEKWAITEGFEWASVITRQISDFPPSSCGLFIAAAFLWENKMICLREYNARNNRFRQMFCWGVVGLTDHRCVPLWSQSNPPHPTPSIYSSVKVWWGRWGDYSSTKENVGTEMTLLYTLVQTGEVAKYNDFTTVLSYFADSHFAVLQLWWNSTGYRLGS